MSRSLPLHGALPEPTSRPRLAISAKGFRPFFALAALHAIAIVPLWLAILGGAASPSAYLDPATWHAHEMVFGFTIAVIAGFLLTAVGNWTSRETVTGVPLLGLAALWAAGRVAMLCPLSLPRGVPALVELAFLPVLIAILARPLIAARNRRNFVMVGVLGALFIADGVIHLDALGVLSPGAARRASVVAVDVVVLVILVVAGRVFPMFTKNATGVSTIRSDRSLDIATIAGMAAVAIADAVAPLVASVLAGGVAFFAAARALHWGARHSSREPLLWILHVGYGWLVVGLVLRAVGAPVWLHALTVGGIGSLTLGMMARVTLGHSGRALVITPPTRWAFVAMTLAAVVRVGGPIVAPTHHLAALTLAGVLWSIAFATFLFVYLPILASPRADGKPG